MSKPLQFKPIPGQEDPSGERWPSSNSGWRLWVSIVSAGVLLGLVFCTGLVVIG